MNNGWNQWVLNYSQSRQLNLLRNLGFDSPDWEDLVLLLAGLVVAAGVVGAAWTFWERRQSDPWLRLLQRARARLHDFGLELGPSAAPRDIAERARRRFGAEQTAALRAWLLRMEAQRYAGRFEGEARRSLQQLQREFQQIAWPVA